MAAAGTDRFTVRCSHSLLEHLDALAAARGVSRAACVRWLIAGAAIEPADVIPGEDELMMILAERARAGHVSAVKLLLDRSRDRDPMAELERLLGRRVGGDGA
jgi:hypothetical protein